MNDKNESKKKKKNPPKKSKNTYQPENSLFKYKIEDTINFKKVLISIIDNGCEEAAIEFEKAIRVLGIDFEKITFHDLIDHLLNHPKWMSWLEDQGFISKISSGISIGDIFIFDGEQCILSDNGGGDIALISLKSGEIISDGVSVSNQNLITNVDELLNIFEIDDGESGKLESILQTRIPKGSYQIVPK